MKIKLFLFTIILGTQGILFGMGGPGATREDIAGAAPVTQRQVPSLIELSLKTIRKSLEQKIASGELDVGSLANYVEQNVPDYLWVPLISKIALRNANLTVIEKLNLLGALAFSTINPKDKKVLNDLRYTLASGIFPMNYKGDLTSKYFTKEVYVWGDRFPLSQTLLHNAIINGDNQLIKLLVDAGSDINAKSGDVSVVPSYSASTPLIWAVVLENIPLIKFLLENGADVNKSSWHDDTTPLHAAIDNGNKEIVKLLINAGADVNKGALLWQSSGSQPIFKLLLDAGADPNELMPDEHIYSNILDWVVSNDRVELARLLLEADAEVNRRIDRQGNRVLDTAIRNRNQEMINLLKKYGAKSGSE